MEEVKQQEVSQETSQEQTIKFNELLQDMSKVLQKHNPPLEMAITAIFHIVSEVAQKNNIPKEAIVSAFAQTYDNVKEFFDELDKVSHTYRGEEIIGLLTHLTDSSQNERFNDRYFGEIDMNLSKALIIFSYNDENKINPILKDRMITIRVSGYDTSDKICIAKDYLIPELLKEYKRSPEDIIFSTEIIEKIIERVPKEEGVRNLKRGIECIISWLNMHTYLPVIEEDSKGRPGKTLKIKLGDTTLTNAQIYTYPVTVKEEHIEKYIKVDEYESMRDCIAKAMYL